MRWIAFLVVLSAVLLLAAACEDQQEQIESQNEAADQRVGTVPIFDMRTDDCFIDTLGLIEAPEGDIGEALEITLVECSDPRADVRVTRTFTVDRDGEWPGEDYLGEQATDGCPGFAGESDVFATFFFPTEESWGGGDRTITCLREVR